MSNTRVKTTDPYRNKYRDELDNEDLEVNDKGYIVAKEKPAEQTEDTEQVVDTENLTDEEKTWAQRYADLRRHSQKQLDAKLKEKDEEIEAAKREVQKYKQVTSPKSDEELEEFRKEYPELTDIINAMTLKQAKELTASLEAEVETLKKDRKTLEKERVHNLISKDHSDWDQIKDSPEFHDWLNEQPKDIQNWIYGKIDADLASKAVKLYKTEKGVKTVKKSSNNERASAAEAVVTNRRTDPPANNQKKVWKASEIAKMDGPTWDKYEDEILLANREGRIDNNA